MAPRPESMSSEPTRHSPTENRRLTLDPERSLRSSSMAQLHPNSMGFSVAPVISNNSVHLPTHLKDQPTRSRSQSLSNAHSHSRPSNNNPTGSIKINMHHHHQHRHYSTNNGSIHTHSMQECTRSFSVQLWRFFQGRVLGYFPGTPVHHIIGSGTNGHVNVNGARSKSPWQVRFGIVLPLAFFSLGVLYALGASFISLVLGQQDHRMPVAVSASQTGLITTTIARSGPTGAGIWIDRGNLTDLEMRPTEGAGMATAILLNWSRLENLKGIVRNLCPQGMFKEIMIWNNNVDVHLDERLFECPKVRVYNSPGNMYFVARYMACAMAASPYCYFQDDDWQIHHLKAMYANFLRFPQFVHTDTNSDVWALTNWQWCFFEDAINMHACFSWLGTGALATRENVVKFLKQASVTGMDQLDFAYGDMFFSTYLNQVPYQLENHLVELPQEFAFSSGGSGKMRNKIYMHKAAQKTWEALLNNDKAFEREELHPTYLERDVRSPCADDRCLVISNKNPFPDVRVFKYRPYIDIEESELIHRQYESPDLYIRFPFSKAVDGRDDTAYKSTRTIVQGDYIGLDMLLPVKRRIEFRLLYQMGDEWIKHARLEVSGNDGLVFTTIPLKRTCRLVKNENYQGPVTAEQQRFFLNQPFEQRRVFDFRDASTADDKAAVHIGERGSSFQGNGQIGTERTKAGKAAGGAAVGGVAEEGTFGMDSSSSVLPPSTLSLSHYEDLGWRTECRFVVHEPAVGFRFMRVVSGRDESYPFVIYNLGWKVI